MDNQPPTVSELDKLCKQIRDEISRVQEQENPKKLVFLLKKLGQAYIDSGDAPQALSEFNEALKIVSNGDDKEAYAQLLGLRGIALKMIGNYSQAMQAFRKSNAVAVAIERPSMACDSLTQIAALQLEMGETTKATTTLTEALELAPEQKDKIRRMKIYILMGNAWLKQGDTGQAAHYNQLALEAAKETENLAAECSLIAKLGDIYLLEGKIEAAINKYELALNLASAQEDRNSEIHILGGLFRAHAVAGNIHPATVYGEQAIYLAGQIEHFDAEVANIQALATYLIDQRLPEKALPLLERGLQVTQEQVQMGEELEILILQGRAYAIQGKFEEALQCWISAFDKASMLQDKLIMATALGNMGAIYAEKGELANSIEAASQALELSLNIENTKLATQQQILLAFNFQELGQLEKAITFCKDALAACQQIEEKEMAAQAESLLCQMEE